jgi:hypothetical protein
MLKAVDMLHRWRVHPQFGANFDSRFFAREERKEREEKIFIGSPLIPQKARVSASPRLRAKFRVLRTLRDLCPKL